MRHEQYYTTAVCCITTYIHPTFVASPHLHFKGGPREATLHIYMWLTTLNEHIKTWKLSITDLRRTRRRHDVGYNKTPGIKCGLKWPPCVYYIFLPKTCENIVINERSVIWRGEYVLLQGHSFTTAAVIPKFFIGQKLNPKQCLGESHWKSSSHFRVSSTKTDSFKFHDHPIVAPLLCIFYISNRNSDLKGRWKTGQISTLLKKNKKNPPIFVLRGIETASFWN